jgi:hypothetical protein
MMLDKEYPIIDYVKRSEAEQRHLFTEGKSKCDGISSISQHQRGKAIDIYFPDLDDIDKDMDKDELLPPNKGWEYWHKYWEEKGGKPIIEWDKGHFEA